MMFCPECGVERADYEGPGLHLPECPNCLSEADPVDKQPEQPTRKPWYEDGYTGPLRKITGPARLTKVKA